MTSVYLANTGRLLGVAHFKQVRDDLLLLHVHKAGVDAAGQNAHAFACVCADGWEGDEKKGWGSNPPPQRKKHTKKTGKRKGIPGGSKSSRNVWLSWPWTWPGSWRDGTEERSSEVSSTT